MGHKKTICEESKDVTGTKIPVNSIYIYKVCKNCKFKEQLPKSSTHRVIQERGLELSIKMKYKMSTEKYQKEYKQWEHTSEPPNGTLKE